MTVIAGPAVSSIEWPRSRGRLVAGLATSILIHAMVVMAVRPMAAALAPSRPLQVNIVEREPSREPASVATATSAFEAPAGTAIESREIASAGRQPQNAAPVPVMGPDLRHVPDRYFTSRELDVRAEPLNDIPLIYPQLAYQKRIKGSVLLSILISEQGEIDRLSVISSEPAGIFEEAALTAAHGLRFSPAIRHGRPVKSRKAIQVDFDPYDSIHIP